MNKRVLVIIAEGSEAVEIVAPVDALRNTDGVSKTMSGKEASLNNLSR